MTDQAPPAPDEPRLPAGPLVLLPVRLETRYADAGAVLRIRVLPDDCAVDSHEPALTDDERRLASAYRDAPADQREERWRELVERFGAERAAWLSTAADEPEARTAAWTRAPRCRVLPSRWHAFGYKDGRRVLSARGEPIPDELALGPDPIAPAPQGDAGMRWLVDFESALAVGMALRVALPPAARGRLDRLVVIGVKEAAPGSSGATAGAERLTGLLAASRYTRGLGFAAEGTPTNNTSDGAAGFNSGQVPPPLPPGPPSPAAPGSNRALVAEALGVPDHVFAGIEGADAGASLNAGRRAMNAALWPATWGYFLEQAMSPLVPRAAIDAVRAHFVDHVRACGPLPVLRIGNQPYGLIVATPLSRWQPRGADAPAGLVSLLNRARPLWAASTPNVPRVHRAGDRPSTEELLAVLSVQPFSLTYRGRSVLGPDYVEAAWRFIRQPLSDAWWQAQRQEPRAVLDALAVPGTPRTARSTFGPGFFGFAGPHVEAGDGGPLKANYPHWLSRPDLAGYRSVRDESFREIAQLPAPRPLLYLLARHGLLLEYRLAGAALAPDRAGSRRGADRDRRVR
jgi:hypothetical protein